MPSRFMRWLFDQNILFTARLISIGIVCLAATIVIGRAHIVVHHALSWWLIEIGFFVLWVTGAACIMVGTAKMLSIDIHRE